MGQVSPQTSQWSCYSQVHPWQCICRFCIPSVSLPIMELLSSISTLLEEHGINYIKSSLYYPQGKAEQRLPTKLYFEASIGWFTRNLKWWINFLPLILWAYRMSKRAPPRNAFLLSLWDRDNSSHRDDGPVSTINAYEQAVELARSYLRDVGPPWEGT